MCRPHKVPGDLSPKGSQAAVHAANAPQFMPQGRLWNEHPPSPPLILSPLGLSCPQSLCLSALHFNEYEEARRCFLYSEMCVRLLGYVVLQCDVEGNKASANREGEEKKKKRLTDSL